MKKQIELGLCQPVSGGSKVPVTQASMSTSALSAVFPAKAQQLETQATDPDMTRGLGALRQIFR